MINPKELHKWYLEATKEINPESYNSEAQKDYNDLDKEQKFIDKFICENIKKKIINKLKKERTNGNTKTEQAFDRGIQFVIDKLEE